MSPGHADARLTFAATAVPADRLAIAGVGAFLKPR
jgi:hypothetical protein